MGQALANGADVSFVAGLDDAMNDNGGDVVARESAVVIDFDDAPAFLGDDGSETREAAGTVADGRAQAAEPTIVSETAFKDATEGGGIDIPAAQGEHDSLSL